MTTKQRLPLYVAWVVAILAMAGSLYFSEVLHFPPCVLCWYQRIAIYPLVILIGIGLLRKDSGLPLYVLPFSIAGFGIAFFHVLLYYGIIPESSGPCSLGISCTTKYIEWFGFVSIPLLSLIGFGIITGCAGLALLSAKKRS